MRKDLCEVKDCPNYQKYCRSHLNAQVKPKTVIEKESDKRKLLNKEYYKNAKKFVQDHPACEASIEGICTHKATCVHHKRGRNSKEDLMDENYWLAVCIPCHSLIEQNPAYSRQQGFSVSRHSKTA